MAKNRYRKLLSNTVILGMGTFASKFLVFFMMPLYTAFLMPEDYGIADLISQTANLLLPLAAVGITDGVFRFAMDSDSDSEKTLSSGLTVLLISSAVFVALCPLLSLYQTLDGYTALIAAYVLAANFHALTAQYLRAKGRMTLFSVGGILGTLLTVLFNILFLVVFRIGVLGYVLSVILGDILTTVFLVLVSKLWREIDFHKVSKAQMGAMLKYSIPMIPTSVFWWVTSVSDRYFVLEMKGADINGLYSAAYKAPTLLILIGSVFVEAWQYSAVSDCDDETRADFFTKVFAGYEAAIFMAASALILLAKPITAVLLADSYYEAWRYLPILALATAFSALTNFMGSVYLVKKKSVFSFLTAGIGALVNIVLNFFLIPGYSAVGAAIATFISYFVVACIRAAHTVRYVRFSLGLPRLAFNTVVVVGQSVLMLSDAAWRIPATTALFAAILVVNGRVLWHFVGGFLKKNSKKREKLSKNS